MIEPENIVFFIAIMFPCYVINSCIEDSPIRFFVGIVCGILITKAFPLVKQQYQQHFGRCFRIYRLDSWCKFIRRFSIFSLMLVFNFLYVHCSGNLIPFSKNSSKLHLSIVIIVFVIMSVCFLLSMLFIQRIVVDYYLGALQFSIGSSTPFIFILVVNWLISISIKISVYQNFSEGIDVFFLYQILIALFLIASIVLLFNSQILYEKGVKEIQYSGEVLPLFLLQWQDSLYYNRTKKFIEIPLKDLDRISVVLKDDVTLDYCCCMAENGDFSWSKENF